MSLSGTLLVTGGAGFIGSHIVARLVQLGGRVRVIDDLSTGHRTNLDDVDGDLDFIHASITNASALRAALCDVEVVFHEAAIPSVPRSVENPRETHEACVNGTFSVLQAAREAGVRRVIYAASSSAYGDQPTLPKSEEMRPDPLSPYAAAKLVGEYYCQVFTRSYGLETVSLRYFNVFGPRQDPSSPYSGVISRFIKALMSDELPIIYGDGEQTRDFTFVSNAVDANILAAESPNAVGEIINVATGEQTTIMDLLQILKKITGKSDVQAEHDKSRIGDVRHSVADVRKASELLGYRPQIGLEEGLRLTIEWWVKKFRGNYQQTHSEVADSPLP